MKPNQNEPKPELNIKLVNQEQIWSEIHLNNTDLNQTERKLKLNLKLLNQKLGFANFISFHYI